MTNFVDDLVERITTVEDSLKMIAVKRDEELALQRKRSDEELGLVKGRLEKELAQRIETERAKLVLNFIAVLDELERAAKYAEERDDRGALREGVEVVMDLFRSRLTALGVTRYAVLGEAFDPANAQALGVEPGEAGIVTLEVLPGYALDGALIRPAKVLVGSGVPVAAPAQA
jgi:molecular chaperone GrpE